MRLMVQSLLKKSSKELLQEAVHEELYASALYLHLSNQCQRLGLFGAAKYFKSESDDERSHYQKHADFMNARGDIADIPAIEAVEDSIVGLKDSVQTAYDAEVALGEKYTEWYRQSLVNDPVVAQHLLQFIEIQTQSIGEYGDLLQRIALAGEDECAILIIDKEMGG